MYITYGECKRQKSSLERCCSSLWCWICERCWRDADERGIMGNVVLTLRLDNNQDLCKIAGIFFHTVRYFDSNLTQYYLSFQTEFVYKNIFLILVLRTILPPCGCLEQVRRRRKMSRIFCWENHVANSKKSAKIFGGVHFIIPSSPSGVNQLQACPLLRMIDSIWRKRVAGCQRGKMAALRAGLLTRALSKGKTTGFSANLIGARAGALF